MSHTVFPKNVVPKWHSGITHLAFINSTLYCISVTFVIILHEVESNLVHAKLHQCRIINCKIDRQVIIMNVCIGACMYQVHLWGGSLERGRGIGRVLGPWGPAGLHMGYTWAGPWSSRPKLVSITWDSSALWVLVSAPTLFHGATHINELRNFIPYFASANSAKVWQGFVWLVLQPRLSRYD